MPTIPALGGIEINKKKPVMMASLRAEIQRKDLPNTKEY
jgi:hypothetical protein